MRWIFERSLWLPMALLVSCSTMPRKNIQPVLHANTWESYDGKEMPWLPKEAKHPRAVVITVHGLSGAASDFWPLGDAAPPKNIAVYGLQLRGQGNDPDLKKRGDIASAKVWQRDLATFHQLVQKRHPGVPIFWYAESMGALIALHTLASLPDAEKPVGLVLSSPAVGLRLNPKPAQVVLIKTSMALLPWKKVNLEKLAGVKDKDIRVTQNSTHEEQMAKTEHYVPEFTLRLLHELYRMMQTLPEVARQTRTPVLVLASPNDVIASPEQLKTFYEQLSSKDKTILWYQKSYHLLLHDVERWIVLADAMKWLEKRTTS